MPPARLNRYQAKCKPSMHLLLSASSIHGTNCNNRNKQTTVGSCSIDDSEYGKVAILMKRMQTEVQAHKVSVLMVSADQCCRRRCNKYVNIMPKPTDKPH